MEIKPLTTSENMPEYIKLNGSIIMVGVSGLRIIFNNLTGKNFESKPSREYVQYLAFMASELGVSFNRGDILSCGSVDDGETNSFEFKQLPSSMFRLLMVKVESLYTDLGRLGEDKHIPGLYGVEVNKDLDDATAAGVAKDIFHCHFGIKCLDNFTISVFDGETELNESDDYDTYSGEHLGGDAWEI